MASATSKVSVVSRGTSVRNKKKSYYVTDVTTLADGSVQRQTYRSDANGNNKQLIQQFTKGDGSGKIVADVELTSVASVRKKRFSESKFYPQKHDKRSNKKSRRVGLLK